jgi:hypothetical protein
MILLAKAALTLGATVAVAGAYTFREGVVRVDVDEFRQNGSHVHVWAPAAAIPMVLHLVPNKEFHHGNTRDAAMALPIVRAAARELRNYPNTTFVEVTDRDQHVLVRTHDGKMQVDVETRDENVHVLCPLSTIDDVVTQLEDRFRDQSWSDEKPSDPRKPGA